MPDEKLNLLKTYAKREWRLVPIAPGRKKKVPRRDPELGFVGGVKGATSDLTRIKAGHEKRPDDNWAWAIPDNHLVMDLDGPEGRATWRKVKKYLNLPTTMVQKTGGGGEHHIFTHNDVDLKKRNRILPGIDLLTGSSNSYIVVEPSIHQSGKAYQFNDELPAEVSLELITLIYLVKDRVINPAEPEPAGGRNDYLTVVGGKLREWGHGEEIIRNVLLAVNQVALEERLPNPEVKTIAASVAGYPVGPGRRATSGPSRTPKPAEYLAALDDLGYTFSFNVVRQQLKIGTRDISDPIRAKVRTEVRELGFRDMQVLEDAYLTQGLENSYHPVLNYLDGLAWDEEDHIAALTEYFEDEDGQFHPLLRAWLLGCVWKVRNPRAHNNPMLILDGRQRLGKSWFARWLCPPSLARYFREGPISPDNKDSLIALAENWIWEVSEVGATIRRADREALKYFISMVEVTVRRPYGRDPIKQPAMANLIGTVNASSGILSDPTGYRRFRVVELKEIDWAYSDAIDLDQLWAQANAAYHNGEMPELDEIYHAAQQTVLERYEQDEPVGLWAEQQLEFNRSDPTFWEPAFSLEEALSERNIRVSARAQQMDLAEVLKKNGCYKRRKLARVDGTEQKITVWFGVRLKSTDIEAGNVRATRIGQRVEPMWDAEDWG